MVNVGNERQELSKDWHVKQGRAALKKAKEVEAQKVAQGFKWVDGPNRSKILVKI